MSNGQWCAFPKGNVSGEDIERVMVLYLEKYHGDDIRDLLNPSLMLSNDDTIHYSIFVDVLHFMSANIEIGSLLLSYPMDLIPIFERALIKAQQLYIDSQTMLKDQLKLKTLIHIRLHSLPQCSEVTKSSVSSIRSCDTNRLISVSGTVIKTGPVKMLEYKKTYICKKCRKAFDIVADREQFNIIMKPTQCPVADCGGKSFSHKSDSITCRDYQEIKIQDKISQLSVGSIPRAILVILEDDLVDIVKAGDDVVITGIPFRRWKPLRFDARCSVEMAICCNHIRINNEKKSSTGVTDEAKKEIHNFWEKYKDKPLAARNLILKSMCPQLFGLYYVKLAVALTIIGGVPMRKNNTRIRGESHLLIVGDPGTGKSQFLRYASKLSPRYVMTNGIGTTSAGLTVMATKEPGGGWTLEAGALVLADGGVCCIDEFDAIREHDRATIHEAMEQQTLSIAKAGLVCKLNTRTSVLAACNPKGKFDVSASLSTNCALASPLLSRFDIVLVLLDTQDEKWDERVSSFILNEQQMEEVDCQLWSFDKLRTYISYVKSEYHPKVPKESGEVLTKYYQLQRRADKRVAARTTIRLLESLVRLAQAHARLMCRNEVTIDDALMAVLTVDISSNTSSLLKIDSVLHSNFPEDPDKEFENQKLIAMAQLGLSKYNPRSVISSSSSDSDKSATLTPNFGTLMLDDDDDGEDFNFAAPSYKQQNENSRKNPPTKRKKDVIIEEPIIEEDDNHENGQNGTGSQIKKKKTTVVDLRVLDNSLNQSTEVVSTAEDRMRNFNQYVNSKKPANNSKPNTINDQNTIPTKISKPLPRTTQNTSQQQQSNSNNNRNISQQGNRDNVDNVNNMNTNNNVNRGNINTSTRGSSQQALINTSQSKSTPKSQPQEELQQSSAHQKTNPQSSTTKPKKAGLTFWNTVLANTEKKKTTTENPLEHTPQQQIINENENDLISPILPSLDDSMLFNTPATGHTKKQTPKGGDDELDGLV
ncbi:hypothetical protein ABK040_001249 [Willaertia magna]